MSSPSLKSTAKYTSFPVIWVSISFINDPRFLLIFSHNCASNLWLMKFFMKQKQYHSSTGEKRKGWNEILFGNQSFYLVPTVLTSTNTVTHKCKQNRKCKCKYFRRHKYKIGGERNVEMKSYLGLSHSPPGLLSNTFCRRRWWEREMTNVKEEEEDRALDIYKSFLFYYGIWSTKPIKSVTSLSWERVMTNVKEDKTEQ